MGASAHVQALVAFAARFGYHSGVKATVDLPEAHLADIQRVTKHRVPYSFQLAHTIVRGEASHEMTFGEMLHASYPTGWPTMSHEAVS